MYHLMRIFFRSGKIDADVVAERVVGLRNFLIFLSKHEIYA